MTAQFDIHDHRSELKQLRDTGDTQLYDNRKRVSCPACHEPFEKVFVTSKEATSFPENDGSRFCLLRQSSDVLLFRH
jgi:hypothetical protein